MDPASKLRAVRELKNACIGNRHKKLEALAAGGLVPSLVEALLGAEPELRVQAAAALGSLAYGVEAGVAAIAAAGGVDGLARALLARGEPREVVAAARALKLIYQSPAAPRAPLLQPAVLARLVELLQAAPQQAAAAEAAASVLGNCCTGSAEAGAVVAAGAVPALVLLLSSPRRSCQEGAVEALAAVTAHSDDACRQLLRATAPAPVPSPRAAPPLAPPPGGAQPPAAACNAAPPAKAPPAPGAAQPARAQPAVVEQLLRLLKLHDSRLRFLCARCVTNLSRAAAPDDADALLPAARAVLPHLVRLLGAAEALAAAGDGHSGFAACGAGRGSAADAVLPGSEAGGDSRYLLGVPLVLSQLMADRPDVQQLALELDAGKTLSRLLHSKAAVAGGLRRGCLLALGALALQGDAARAQMVEGGRLVTTVVAALADADAQVRAAAAVCLRGLCRSARLLRGGTFPDGVAAPLVALLQDSAASEVQGAAAAAACNLLLSFSSARAALLAAGALPALAPLVASMLPELRLHGAWALKNLADECDAATRAALLAELPWPALQALLGDDDARVREQATGLLQNLCKAASLDELTAWSGGGLLPLLEQQLDPGACAAAAGGDEDAGAAAALCRRVERVLYAAANVCSGSEAAKDAVMASRLPALLLAHLRAGGGGGAAPPPRWLPELRLAAVWCVINLLWCDPPPGEDARAAAALQTTLQAAGAAAGAADDMVATAEAALHAADAAAAAPAAAAAGRAAALRGLGFEAALRALLDECTRGGARPPGDAGPSAAAAAASPGGGGGGCRCRRRSPTAGISSRSGPGSSGRPAGAAAAATARRAAPPLPARRSPAAAAMRRAPGPSGAATGRLLKVLILVVALDAVVRLAPRAPHTATQQPAAAAAPPAAGAPPPSAAAANLTRFANGLLGQLSLSFHIPSESGFRAADWKVFAPTVACPPDRPLKLYGGAGDGGKALCSLESFRGSAGDCVIYSMGSNGNFLFEEAMLRDTPCKVHTFDCTFDGRSLDAGARHTYHKWCIGAAPPDGGGAMPGAEWRTYANVTAALGHARVQVLKADIEGWEYVLLGTWSDPAAPLPEQLAIEVHVDKVSKTNYVPHTPAGLGLFFLHLANLGYAAFFQEVNAGFPGVACEFSFLRVPRGGAT
ncbi:ARMC8 [Scenedesmus sp. PABB004]|nr:ARMC8 [Scenedesmus sp. PABB004]